MAGKRDKADIDSAVRDMVEERIDPRTGIQQIEEQVVASGPTDAETIANQFSHIPPNEGYYVKLYKRYPTPKEYGSKPVFLCDVLQPELYHDMESKVLELVKGNGWGDGIYEVKLVKGDEPGFKSVQKIVVQLPIAPVPTQANGSNPQQTFDPTGPAIQILKLAREFAPPSPPVNTNPGTDPLSIVKAITEAYKVGIDSAIRAMPVPVPAPARSDDSKSTAELIKAIKELLPQPQQPPDPFANVERVGALFKSLMPTQKEPAAEKDPLEMALKLKELFAAPPAPPDQTDKIISLVTALAPLMRGNEGPGEPPSALIELIRGLTPQVGKIVENAAGVLNNAMAFKAGVMNPAPVRVQQPQPTSTSPPPPLPAQAPTVKEDGPVVPAFQAIKEAVEANDKTFFPQLEELLQSWLPAAQYQAILTGEIPVEQVMTVAQRWGGSYFAGTKPRNYFQEFINWAKQQHNKPETIPVTEVPPPPPLQTENPNEVVARCQGCGQEWTFENDQTLAENGLCEECKGKLVKIA